jgi:transcriptional regulator with XRE-family HTH domain
MGKIRIDRKKLDYMMLMRDVPTYRELAKRVGVHHNTVNNMVNRGEYSTGLLEKVADVLGVNPLDLISTEGYPDPILVADRYWDQLLADPRSPGALHQLADEARTTPEEELAEGW